MNAPVFVGRRRLLRLAPWPRECDEPSKSSYGTTWSAVRPRSGASRVLSACATHHPQLDRHQSNASQVNVKKWNRYKNKYKKTRTAQPSKLGDLALEGVRGTSNIKDVHLHGLGIPRKRLGGAQSQEYTDTDVWLVALLGICGASFPNTTLLPSFLA
ncbi:hypothetical protein LX36DRAFT_664875 [Colletotrichum falcatum]|nr:hypothetical protein LX36DRAFT_664875 [Colletotrichum falcatum]